MTKKHYEAIARILQWHITSKPQANANAIERERVATGTHYAESIAEQLATYFEQDNPKFDRVRFLTACGIEQEVQECAICDTPLRNKRCPMGC